MKNLIIFLGIFFGAGQKKENGGETPSNPVPITTLPGNGKKVLSFKNELIALTFKSRGTSFLYDVYLRPTTEFVLAFPPGNRVLKISMEQGILNEEVVKAISCTTSAKKGIEFRTNFQDITWPAEKMGQSHLLEVYERSIKPVRTKTKKIPPKK